MQTLLSFFSFFFFTVKSSWAVERKKKYKAAGEFKTK